MDISSSRYASDVIKVIQDISESHFVAFDLEFSGIAPHSQRNSPGKPTLQELYDDSKVAAIKYQVLQVGLAIVKEDVESGQYIIKPYNFNISPLPTLRERQFTREWSMSSGAVQFLLRNRFDFGLPLTNGVPYLSRAEEIQARLNMSGEEDRRRADMILKPDDENLIKHIRTSIAAWQEQPEDNRESYLNIPNDSRGKGVPGVLNRYQMRLTHQIVQNEFPQFKTTSMREFVQVTNPTQMERDRIKTFQREHIDREIGRAVGFRWILEAICGKDISGMPDECFLAAISQFGKAKDGLTPFRSFVANLNEKLSRRRKVLVGHNCFTDLIYLHHFFHGELPDRVEDFQDSIHELFPAVVDTKHIASFGNGRWRDTSLAAVEEDLRDEVQPSILVPPEFDRYSFNEKPHEAGYDALLTANIAIKLSAKMEREATYYDQETPRATNHNVNAHVEAFGIKEEGYVTASEDIDSQLSDVSSAKEPASQSSLMEGQLSQPMRSEDIDNMVLSLRSASNSHLQQNSASNPTNMIAIKDKKPRPVDWNSTAEVEKVRSAFAAANIYDILEKDPDARSDSNEEEGNLLASDGVDAATHSFKSENEALGPRAIEEMVKHGKLMPRWGGGNGFWQVFGNKLQVNSCKEGVCNL